MLQLCLVISRSGVQSFRARNQRLILREPAPPPGPGLLQQVDDISEACLLKISPGWGSGPPLSACEDVVEVRPLLCLVCPSQPPASSVGRSSSWAREAEAPAGLRCHRSSPPLAPTAHWPAGKTAASGLYCNYMRMMTANLHTNLFLKNHDKRSEKLTSVSLSLLSSRSFSVCL